MAITLGNPENALRLLVELGAPPWLVRHHELVVEAASVLCQRVPAEVGVSFDCDEVLLGAALHDVGKILHPDEMKAPGHRHESAGESLLVQRGVPPEIARFCVTHASWDTPGRTLEDLLVALADKLWKGKREEGLEARVIQMIAAHSKREQWEVFDQLDSICEQIAADGTSRLARSVT